MEMYIETINENTGENNGFWTDVEFKSFDELQADIEMFLKENASESYKITDYDNMLFFGLHPDINDIVEYVELCDLHGQDVTNAATIIGTSPQNFIGECDDLKEFAKHYAEDSQIFEYASDTVVQFFDYKRYGEFLLKNCVDEHNGFYFRK